MDIETARVIASSDINFKCTTPLSLHPVLDRVARGRARWESYVSHNDGRKYRNSYPEFLAKKFSDVIIEARRLTSQPIDEINDGRNCIGGNCCYTSDFRCHHPMSGFPTCSRRY